MANNRLFLRCRRCGEEIIIARFSAGAQTWSASRTPADEYDTWLATHTVCGDEPWLTELDVELTSENAQFLKSQS